MKTKRDEAKKILRAIDPLFHEFHLKDVLQVIIGASIFALPVGLTNEVWELGENLPVANIAGFIFLSLLFIFLFTYYHYHREYGIRKYPGHLAKRVVLTYILSSIVVALLLTLVQKAPWQSDWLLAFKRIALATFPASMSGTIADVIK